MSDLKQALERWDDLSDAEVNALAAVYVRGYRWVKWFRDDGSFFYQLVSPEDAAGWVSRSGHRHEFDDAYWPDTKNMKHDCDGAPPAATDYNDLVECVRAFKQTVSEHCLFLCDDKIGSLSVKRGRRKFSHLAVLLLNPRDVLKAMIEALAESESEK
jgi:hypothetical protein